MPHETPELLPLGPDGILVRFSGALSDQANRAALAFRAALTNQPDGVVETATSLTSVFLRFRPDVIKRAALEDWVRNQLGTANWYDRPLPSGRKLWRLPTSFGGADGPALDEAADLAGISPQSAIDEICGASLRVLALGFAPGQPYLGFLPDHWDIPRQRDVTPQVPRGAVIVAVRQVIPFANAAPTGWRQIGRTSFRCYDASAHEPVSLRPGDEVSFLSVTPAELAAAQDRPLGGALAELI